MTGEPIPLEVEREGDARASLGPPPPLFVATPPCEAEGKPAAEEANCDPFELMVRDRAEDSSWPDCGCCTPCEREKGDEVDDTEELRLRVCRVDAAGTEVDAVLVGGKVLREGLLDEVLGRLEAEENAVDIGDKPRRC